MPRFVEQAENYFKDQIITDKCVSTYGQDHCSGRWHAKGFICFAKCRDRIPDYAPPIPGSEPIKFPTNPVYAEQDRERGAARARIIGDGKNPDGTPTAAAIAYVELCSRQIRANMARFAERNTQATQPLSQPPHPNQTPAENLPPKPEPVYPDTRSIAQLLETLGVKATERKQEPPP
jgi:hypothetical protein